MSVTTVDLRAVTAGPGRLGQATRVTSEGAVTDLAHWLLSPNRDWAVVVISCFDVGRPPVDPDEVARRLDSYAEVYAVASGPLTRHLAELLPEGAAVYANAVRIYPAGTGWTSTRVAQHCCPATRCASTQ